jgi:hypothetical protein
LSLLCEAAWEEIGEESLDGTKYKDVSNWRERDDKDNENRKKRYDILEGSPIQTTKDTQYELHLIERDQGVSERVQLQPSQHSYRIFRTSLGLRV